MRIKNTITLDEDIYSMLFVSIIRPEFIYYSNFVANNPELLDLPND